MSRFGRTLAGLLALTLAATPLSGQTAARVASGVEPDTVTVGDVFRAAIRVDAPAGASLLFPERLEPTAAYQPVGQRRIAPQQGSGTTQLAVYSLVAWQTGTLPSPIVPIRVRHADGTEQVLRVRLPLPHVRSVLPADTSVLEPRPAKDILPADARAHGWLWLLALLALLLLLGAVASRRLRRPRSSADTLPALSPRDRALAELQRARLGGYLEVGAWKPFYSLISEALRGYLASLSSGWGTELTTSELLAVMRAERASETHVAGIGRVLVAADLVKFARHRPSTDQALAAWKEARELVVVLEPEPSAELAATERVA